MPQDKLKLDGIFANGYGIIPKAVMCDPALSVGAKALYSYFCSYAGAGDSCFPSQSIICRDLNISAGSFAKYLKALTDGGYIDVEQKKENGRFSHNVYHILHDISPPPCTKLPYPKISDTEKTVYQNLETKNNSLKINKLLNNNSEILLKNNKGELDKPPASAVAKQKTETYAEAFDALWESYPRKIGKKRAFDAYKKAIKSGTTDEAIADGIERYRQYVESRKFEEKYIKQGSTWFVGECWNDEYEISARQLTPDEEREYQELWGG